MKEHKSHMSMVARIAYIFATIVTVFAQMGAAAPAILTDADTEPTATMLVNKNGYKVGEDMAVTITTTNMPEADLHFDPTYFSFASVDKFSGSVKNSNGVVELIPDGPNVGTVTVHLKVNQDLGQAGSRIYLKIDGSAWLGLYDATEQYDAITVTNIGNMSRADVQKTTVNDGGTVNDKDINLSVPGGIELTKDEQGNTSNYGVTLNVYGTTAKTGTHTRAGTSMPWVTSGDSFVISWKGDGLTPMNGAIDAALEKEGFYTDWTTGDDQVTITAGKTIPAGWSFDMEFVATGDTTEADFTVKTDKGVVIDTVEQDGPGVKQDPGTTTEPTTDPTTEPTTDPDPTAEINNLTSGDLSLVQMSKSPYDLKAPIQYMFTANLNNYPTQYRDVQFKVNETDENGNATNQKAIFDPDLTKTYAEDKGLSVSGPTESEDHTVYTYSNGDQEYNVWVFKDNSIRVEFPKGTTGTNLGFLVMRANQSSDKVTLTPTFVGSKTANDDPVSLKDGTGFDFKINPSPTVDATGLRLDPQAVAPVNGETYHLSTFPLFYMKDDSTTPSLYSFIYNYNSTGIDDGSKTCSLESLRKAIIAGIPYTSITGGAESTTSDQAGYFENFHAINESNGEVIKGSEKPFDVDKTYTMIPYNPVAGTTDRFQRIKTEKWESKNYYMPDGIPTFSVDATGKITLQSDGDGKAIKGQWSAEGSQINVKLYHVKQVKVVDQDGNAVPDASLTLENTAGSNAIFLHGKTGSKGEAGDLYPSDNLASDDTQPFYYPDGTQEFGSLSLPTGYTQDIAFTGMNLSKTDDTLSLTGEKNAAIVDNGQTLQLTVWKTSASDSQVNIKKIDATSKDPLAGANFTVEETGNATGDSLKSGTTYTSGDDGMVSGISVDAGSTAKTRTFHITETKAPDSYSTSSQDGYDATWTKGTGFTAVGVHGKTQTDDFSDGVVSIENGTLVFADTKLLFDGGGASGSGLKFEYVDHAGNPISGAQLPTLEENHQYGSTDGNLGISGIGGVIYNPATDPATLKVADSGLVAGTGLAGDSTMAKSQEKSDASGMGLVQGLWSQLGISSDWESLDPNSNAYYLSHAIEKNFIPNTPQMIYGLYKENQQARAEATNASDYYSMGSKIQIGETNKKINATLVKVPGLRDNLITTDPDKNAAVVALYKVKHVVIHDANNRPVIGATVRFTNLVTAEPTNGDGEADLVPADSKGNPTTNFAFPDGTQKFISAKDSEGNDLALGDNATTFGTWIDKAADDNLVKSGTASNITISDGSNADYAAGQYVELKTTTAQTKTVIHIHKESALNADTPVQGVTFHVWKADQDEGSAVQTNPTDENGDTTATFDTASGNGNYVIKEDTLPTDVLYKQDTQEHTFSADDSGSVTGVKAGDSVITTDTDGALHFADMPNGGGGGIGDNGTNGGDLKIQKIDKADGSTVQSDATQFTVTQTMPSTGYSETKGTKDGVASFNVGEATTGDKVFKIVESHAPDGYADNTKAYVLRVQKDGTMTLGDYGALNTDIVDDHTADGTIKFVSAKDHTLLFGDDKVTTGNNGGLFSLQKLDAANPTQALSGATFSLDEVGTTDIKNVGGDTTTGTDGKLSFDLGQSTNVTRYFKLIERTAPLGYTLNTKIYAIQITADGTVTVAPIDSNSAANQYNSKDPGASYKAMQAVAFTNASPNGTVTVNGKGVTFLDSKTGTANNGTLTFKKVDNADRTQGLSGAKFGFSEYINTRSPEYVGHEEVDDSVAPSKVNFIPNYYDSEMDGTVQVGLNGATNSTRMITVGEAASPTGYVASTNQYRIYIDPAGKYTVAQKVNGSWATPAATTADGVLQVDANNNLTFGDTKKPTTNSFSMKKTDASDQTSPVTGNATFSVIQVNSSNGSSIGSNMTVTTTNGDIKTTTMPSSLTSGTFLINEESAPTGWKKEVSKMYFTWDADKGVTGVGTDFNAIKATPAKDPAGLQMMKIDTVNGKGVLNYSDEKIASASGALTIKKVDSVDKTKVLPNAKFTIEPATPTTTDGIMGLSFGTAVEATTDANGLIQYQPTTTTGTQYFRITETSAPDGYLKASSSYIVSLQNGKISTAFGTDKVTSNVHTLGDVRERSSSEYAGASVVDGQLVVQDAPKPVIRIKKVSSVTGQTLAGAKIVWSETDANGKAFTPAAGADERQAGDSFTTLSDGIAEFTPTAKIVGSTHYYRITEETAPTGYGTGDSTVIVYKVGTGIIGLKPVDTKATTSTPMDATKSGPLTVTNEKVNGYLNVIQYTDEPLSYSLHVRRQAQKGTDSTPAYLGIGETAKVYIQKADGTGNQYQVPVTNDYKIKNSDLAKGLGLDSMPTSGTDVLKISVDPNSVPDYTVPAPRTVNFTWGPNGGFSQITSEGMMTDTKHSQQPDTANKMANGDLRLLVRRDTLIAKNSGTLDNKDAPLIKNASFTLNYYLSPFVTKDTEPIATQVVKTNENGVGLIKEPSALLKSNVALNTMLTVQVSQTPDQQTSGYELFKDPVTLAYFSGTGFSLFTGATDGIDPQYLAKDGSKDPYIDDATVGTDTATGLTTSTYSFGGSQITVPLTKILNNLTLDSAPKVLNFGHAQVLSGAQKLDLLPNSTANDLDTKANLATFANDVTDTDDKATAAGDFLNAQVTQVGDYTTGWRLKLAMSTLNSESDPDHVDANSKEGEDYITDGTVSFGAATVTREGDATKDLGMGIQQGTEKDGLIIGGVPMDGNITSDADGNKYLTDYAEPLNLVNTGSNSIAGVYNIAWDVNNVKMNLPAMVGKLNTNYRSTMAWMLTTAP